MKKGYDPLRGYDPACKQSEVYSYTKQLCKQRQNAGEQAWTGKKTDIFGSKSTANFDRWYGQSYKPIRKRVEHPNTNPINSSFSTAKVEKYFDRPEQFRGSVKKAVFSERVSNLFQDKQTQVHWKTSIKPIPLPKSGNIEEEEKPHIRHTDYSDRYKRNPITNENVKDSTSKRPLKKPERNPITDGQVRQFLQRKGRAQHHTTIVLG